MPDIYESLQRLEREVDAELIRMARVRRVLEVAMAALVAAWLATIAILVWSVTTT